MNNDDLKAQFKTESQKGVRFAIFTGLFLFILALICLFFVYPVTTALLFIFGTILVYYMIYNFICCKIMEAAIDNLEDSLQKRYGDKFREK